MSNHETGTSELRKVTNVFRNTTNILIEVVTEHDNIQATMEHPFYVEGEGYVAARDLTIGDRLRSISGEIVKVLKINIINLQEEVIVYNFEVEGLNNYYVAEDGILVHNKCRKLRQPRKNVVSKDIQPDGSVKYKLKTKAGKEFEITYNKDGYPIFDDFAKVGADGKPIKADIDYTGNRGKYFKLANEKAGLEVTPDGYTWHHTEDGKGMMLVQTEIHKATSHTGGFSIFKWLGID